MGGHQGMGQTNDGWPPRDGHGRPTAVKKTTVEKKVEVDTHELQVRETEEPYLCSDTMLEICNLYSREAKGHNI
jgi:hypothetical protein